MGRKRVQNNLIVCKGCGSTIKQDSRVSTGYCRYCRDIVSKQWQQTPFLERVRILDNIKTIPVGKN